MQPAAFLGKVGCGVVYLCASAGYVDYHAAACHGDADCLRYKLVMEAASGYSYFVSARIARSGYANRWKKFSEEHIGCFDAVESLSPNFVIV